MNIVKSFSWIILITMIFMESTMAQSSLTKEQFSERLEQQEHDSNIEISSVEINDF